MHFCSVADQIDQCRLQYAFPAVGLVVGTRSICHCDISRGPLGLFEEQRTHVFPSTAQGAELEHEQTPLWTPNPQ